MTKARQTKWELAPAIREDYYTESTDTVDVKDSRREKRMMDLARRKNRKYAHEDEDYDT